MSRSDILYRLDASVSQSQERARRGIGRRRKSGDGAVLVLRPLQGGAPGGEPRRLRRSPRQGRRGRAAEAGAVRQIGRRAGGAGSDGRRRKAVQFAEQGRACPQVANGIEVRSFAQ